MRPAPGPRVAPDGIIAAVIAQRSQLLEQADQRQPFAWCGSGVLRQQPVQLRLPAPDLGTRLNLPLIRERRPPRPQPLPNRVARSLQVARDLLDRPALDQMLASDPADRLHNQHSPPPTSNRSGQPTSHTFRGSILDADPPAQGVKIPRRNTARDTSQAD